MVFGHEGTVQAFVKLDQLTVHLSYLQHRVSKQTNSVFISYAANAWDESSSDLGVNPVHVLNRLRLPPAG